MEKRTPFMIFLLGILVLCLPGCLPSIYDTSALCGDREVVYCEDFESLSPLVYTHNLAGTGWTISLEEILSQSIYELPLEGRSPKYLASIGYLSSDYENGSQALLHTEIINLTDASTATLYFNLLYLTEPHWDGLILIATQDHGENWIILEPQGGYPDTIQLEGRITPGYSGNKPYWIHEEVDLTTLLGSEVSLGFYFLADRDTAHFGVALDDIVVDADTKGKASSESQIRDFPEVNLVLPQDPLIMTEIPRVNALVNTPCEGEESEILKESQRAFVKAVNETGDRFFVLHPESGNFCWVGQEDVWIDQNDYDLPQLSDQKPEDLFLPICALTRVPVLSDPVCLSGTGSGEKETNLLTYQIQSALVEVGKITMVVMDPRASFVEESTREIPDSRVSGMEAIPGVKIDPGQNPGGIISVTINDVKETCTLDKEHPGRVVCDDLSLDAAGPLRVEICWQGWDEGSRCPPGFGANPTGEGCTILPDPDSCTLECPNGYLFSPGDGLCLIKNNLLDEDRTEELCPDGFLVNPEAGCCVPSTAIGLSDCPDGYYYAPATSSCQRMLNEGTCPEGYISQVEPAACILETGTAPPVCAVFEVNFPLPEVTVKKSTRCWKGPGSSYETVSSLKPFTIVEVLGIGEVGEYLVVNNPTYQIPCWVNEDDLYLDKLDLTILPVIPVSSKKDQPAQDN
jgi:hypothetical protein